MCIRYVPVGTSSYETKHKTSKIPMRFRAKRCLPGLPAPRLAGSGLCY
jgi:hypothetical protein